MPYLSVQEMKAMWGAERGCIERLHRNIQDSIESTIEASSIENLDHRLVSRAVVPLLLTIAAEKVFVTCPAHDLEGLEHYFMRCAAEAMMASLNDPHKQNLAGGN